jgi:hypothetical protein
MPLSLSDKFEWIGTIETASGQAMNVLEPEPGMISLDDVARSLSHICRYNGHVPHFYSVAEHSVRVAWWLRIEGCSLEIQLTGLLHDAAEAYVGDMVRPLKRSFVGVTHQQVEDKVAEALHSQLGGVYPYPDIIHTADRAVYDWEVSEVRTGHRVGWLPDFAMSMFTSRYHRIIGDLHATPYL